MRRSFTYSDNEGNATEVSHDTGDSFLTLDVRNENTASTGFIDLVDLELFLTELAEIGVRARKAEGIE